MTARMKTQANGTELPSGKRLTSKKFISSSKQIEQTRGYLNRAAKSLKELNCSSEEKHCRLILLRMCVCLVACLCKCAALSAKQPCQLELFLRFSVAPKALAD